MIEKYKPSEVLFGEPRSISGKKLELATKIKKISEKIEKEYKIKTVFWDEWRTSKLAKKHRKNIHAISASYILQDYLDFLYNKEKSEKK